MQQINISILAGQDGGLIVYEAVDGEQVLAFGGNLDEASKYLSSRMSKVIVTGGERREVPHQRSMPLLRKVEDLDVAK